MGASASAALFCEILLDEMQQAPDGAVRSWIMLLPEGAYEHPKGTLDLSRKMLSEVKANFDKRVRGVDIALDYDHKASDGDSKAFGWIERVEFFEAGKAPLRQQVDGYPSGLWAQVKWTNIGLDAVRDQIYRYISAEYRPEWTNPVDKKTYHNVLIGATLTNRPFMNHMPAVQLSEYSSRAWGDVDKSKLPNSAFLDPKNRRLPVYEGSGEIGADGRYSERGKLNINGVRAALAAVHGAHTGHAMSGLPSGIEAKLQRWVDAYDNNPGGAKGKQRESKQMSNVRNAHLNKLLGTLDDEDMDLDDEGDAEAYDELDDGMDDELGLDDDGDDDTEGEGDTDDVGESPAINGRSRNRGGQRRPARRGQLVGAGASGESKQMSESKEETVSLAEAQQLREQVRDLSLLLFEQQVDKTIKEWETPAAEGVGAIVTTKAFNDAYRAFMLKEGFTLSESTRNEVQELINLALKGTVELGQRSLAQADMESRQTRKPGQGDANQVAERIEAIALEEYGKTWKALQHDATKDETLKVALRDVVKRAWRETGYDPIKLSQDVANSVRLRD